MADGGLFFSTASRLNISLQNISILFEFERTRTDSQSVSQSRSHAVGKRGQTAKKDVEIVVRVPAGPYT